MKNDVAERKMTRVLMETRISNGKEFLIDTTVDLWENLPPFVQFILPILGICVVSTTTVFSLLEAACLFVFHTDSFLTWGFVLTFEGIVLGVMVLIGAYTYVLYDTERRI